MPQIWVYSKHGELPNKEKFRVVSPRTKEISLAVCGYPFEFIHV